MAFENRVTWIWSPIDRKRPQPVCVRRAPCAMAWIAPIFMKGASSVISTSRPSAIARTVRKRRFLVRRLGRKA